MTAKRSLHLHQFSLDNLSASKYLFQKQWTPTHKELTASVEQMSHLDSKALFKRIFGYVKVRFWFYMTKLIISSFSSGKQKRVHVVEWNCKRGPQTNSSFSSKQSQTHVNVFVTNTWTFRIPCPVNIKNKTKLKELNKTATLKYSLLRKLETWPQNWWMFAYQNINEMKCRGMTSMSISPPSKIKGGFLDMQKIKKYLLLDVSASTRFWAC